MKSQQLYALSPTNLQLCFAESAEPRLSHRRRIDTLDVSTTGQTLGTPMRFRDGSAIEHNQLLGQTAFLVLCWGFWGDLDGSAFEIRVFTSLF